eukprot:gene1622-1779_t
MEEESLDNWKQFRGTELGGLLGQIYGNQNRPRINYPKPTTRSSSSSSVISETKKDFIPGGAKLTAVDPRQSTKRAVKVAVPKPTRGHSSDVENIRPVDCIAHRRGADVIKAELEEIKMRQEYYRPAFTKAISSDNEKERLRQICTFKGGKALPQGCTLPVGEMPLEVEAKKKEAERIHSIKVKHGKAFSSSGTNAGVTSSASVEDQLADQLTEEIDSLRQHIEEMKEIGISSSEDRKLRLQLSHKMQELQRIKC